MEQKEVCCTQKLRHRDEKELKDLFNRLNRIEGQVRGVKAMVEQERYCVDILTQVSAIQSALNAFNKKLLSSHIRGCVMKELREGSEEEAEIMVEELCETMKKIDEVKEPVYNAGSMKGERDESIKSGGYAL